MPRPVADSGTGWWSIRIRMPDGKRKKYMLAKQPGWTLGKQLPKKPPPEIEMLARKYQDMALQIRHGVDVSVVRADDLRQFMTEYQTVFATGHRPNSIRILGQAVKHFLEFCDRRGIKTAQMVTVAVCEAYMHARRKYGAARSTIHVEKGCLSPAWTRAVRNKTLSENPWKLAPVPGKPSRTEVDYWSIEELNQLVAASAGWVRDIILLGANCGGRITSLLTLEWKHVHFDRNVIRLDSKTGTYEVPMSAVARDVLERRHIQHKGPRVFPARDPTKTHVASVVYVAIQRIVRKAGIPEKGNYNHILRHTFASHAVMRGVNLVTVSKWLGHSTINMTMRYAHLAKSESQRQMKEFSLGSDPLQTPPIPPPDDAPTPQPPDD